MLQARGGDTHGGDPRGIFQHHAEALGAEDIDAIVSDYDDDAIVMTPDGVLRGKAPASPKRAGVVAFPSSACGDRREARRCAAA